MVTARNIGWMLLSVVLTASLTMWVWAGDTDAEATTTPEVANVNGTWSYSFEGFNGTVEVALKLQQDGQTLTGTITGFGGTEDTIQEGKVNGDEISFKVVRDFGDQTAVTTYTGTVSGDSLKGKTEMTFTREFEATRAAG